MYRWNASSTSRLRPKREGHPQSGQALVEYVLIIVLVVIAFSIALAATGPAISNVFSNAVYNLVAEAGTPQPDLAVRGGPTAFWLTVTWAADPTNQPDERPFPTNEPPPPTEPPTEGPPPPATNTPLPTNTPTQTPTQGPTDTPVDREWIAPYTDPMNEPVRWRVDNSVFLGGEKWRAEFYPNTTLSGTPDFTQFLDGINLAPGTGNSVITTSPWLSTNYSIKFTKNIYLESPTSVTFNVSANDGVRLWLLAGGQQAGSCLGGTGVSPAPNPGGAATGDRRFGDPATHCLLIDDWNNQAGGSTAPVTRTIPAGLYTLQLDYYQGSGDHSIRLDAVRGAGVGSPDDNTVPAGGSPNCTWAHSQSDRANTFQNAAFMWEENSGPNNDAPANMVCHLELRGWVTIPAGMNQPEFTFWDVWDFGNANTRAWVEFARHVPNSPSEGWGLDRTGSGVTWVRATPDPLRVGPSTNYAWTFNRIDLAALGFVEGDEVTFRFVIQNSGGGSNRRWYIDDLAIAQSSVGTRVFNVGKFWNLEDQNQKNEFIASGRWEITTNTRARGTSSWEESPSANYSVNEEGTRRIHSLELNGWVDLSGSTPDLDGDTGDPLLSFYHSYELASGSHIELQYTRDAYDAVPDTWFTVPGAGLLVPPGTNTRAQPTITQVEVSLIEIPNYNTQRFRLRFALIVNTTSTGQVDDGWWIDEIYVERDEVDRFSNYPFLDTAESPNNWWRFDGLWGRTTATGVFGSTASFADTPTGSYSRGTNGSMTLRYPLDLNNDTEVNRTLYNGNFHWASTETNPIQNTPENTANRPVLSFWHWRDLNPGAILLVEWRRVNDPDTNWLPLWQYQYGNYFDGGSRSATGTQIAWERVEVDLRGITYNASDANLTDDDVYIRFRLDVRNSNARDGVYLDNILIENRVESVYQLWPVSGGGDGTALLEQFETDWFNRWYAGGNWAPVSYTVRGGLQSMHDSGSGQSGAPPPDSNGNIVTRHDTWQVLELRTIIDLTNSDSSLRPLMRFWSRWYTGNEDRIYVQISVENAADNTQGYDKIAGWSRWSTVWGSNLGSSSDPDFIRAEFARNYTWVRRQVSLQSYVGSRIRVRFISDALDDDDNRDGWYLDDIVFTYREPQTIFPVGFSDPASNLNNWVAEGTWGLDPEVFFGSGGGPAALGPNAWFGYYYRCPNNDCSPTRAGSQLLDRIPRTLAASLDAVRNPLNYYTGVPANANFDSLNIELTEVVIDVNRDFRTSGPRGDLWATNDFAGRWIREIRIQPGQFTFITISDDGVRMRVEPTTDPIYWNLINRWSDQSRTVSMATVTLGGTGTGPDGNNYTLILEYYENSGDAAIVLSAGNNNFSFTDSPKPLAGGGLTTEVPAIPRGNSALVLNGVVDLRNLEGNPNFVPVLQYDTYYELNNDSYARVEVSTDGGFAWTQAGLNTQIPSTPPINASNPTINNATLTQDQGPWQSRIHNLTPYVGSLLSVRFRLDRQNTDTTDANSGNQFRISWWLVNITFANAG